jgi:hypothetical protein
MTPPSKPRKKRIKYVSPTYTIIADSQNAKRYSAIIMEDTNPPNALPTIEDEGLSSPLPEMIRIFNVSRKKHSIDRPGAPGGSWVIHPCSGEEEYGCGPVFPLIARMAHADAREGVKVVTYQGEFLAQDILNPEDPFGDAETADKRIAMANENTNLYRFGCFWSRNAKPSKAELALAHERLAHYGGRAEALKNLSIELAKIQDSFNKLFSAIKAATE